MSILGQRGRYHMNKIDVARIAELSSTGLLAAKVRLTLAKVRDDGINSFDRGDRARLELAATYLQTVINGWDASIIDASEVHALVALESMENADTVREAFATMTDDSEETGVELDRIERVRGMCASLAAGSAPPEADINDMNGFFRTLSAFTLAAQQVEMGQAVSEDVLRAG